MIKSYKHTLKDLFFFVIGLKSMNTKSKKLQIEFREKSSPGLVGCHLQSNIASCRLFLPTMEIFGAAVLQQGHRERIVPVTEPHARKRKQILTKRQRLCESKCNRTDEHNPNSNIINFIKLKTLSNLVKLRQKQNKNVINPAS